MIYLNPIFAGSHNRLFTHIPLTPTHPPTTTHIKAYYRGAMGIFLVYDVTDEQPFLNIRNWIRNIETHASDNVEKILIGNKCDRLDDRVLYYYYYLQPYKNCPILPYPPRTHFFVFFENAPKFTIG